MNFEAENTNLINNIIDLYVNARKPIGSENNNKVVRSRSHVISSQVEDLFAKYFSKHTEKYILIDKLFSIKENGDKTSLQPDITIRSQVTIEQFYDVKMDLGWKLNGFKTYCDKKVETIKKLRGKTVKCWDEYLKVSENIKYDIIIVSSKNLGKEKLLKLYEVIEDKKFKDYLDFFILTSEIHPNEQFPDKTKKNIVINHNELNRLIEKIKIA